MKPFGSLKFEFHVMFTCYEMLLFFGFFQPFKGVKSILRVWAMQKQVVGLVWTLNPRLARSRSTTMTVGRRMSAGKFGQEAPSLCRSASDVPMCLGNPRGHHGRESA